MRHSAADHRPILVWDLPVRLFHWLTAVLVAVAYVTWRLNWMDWHAYAGEALLALVLFRLAWGFVGSDTARFSRFLASPGAAVRHLAHAFRRNPDAQIGHNAAGGWMVLVLLALLLGQAMTGLIDNNDVANAGPLTDIMPAWLSNLIDDLHTWLWNALLTAIALHLLAIAVYALAKGHNLLRPMLTGRKILPREAVAPRLASPMLAVLLLAGSAAAAALLASFL
ncbi:MAG TPA: cytochrome b/b6 domain-containing protein [Acetobacteraceae bacterium]|nr:cytochrome b/b6 domain-containing protein [Acetobacteraceae bacterium]